MALKDYDELIRRRSDVAEFYSHRALLLQTSLQQFDKAIADYDSAIRLEPLSGGFYSSRGGVWRRKKEYHKAIQDYERAIALSPKVISAYTAFAELLATCPEASVRDGVRAVELAKQALALGSPYFDRSWELSVLAAAYAECGRFEEAIRYQKEALDDPRMMKYFRDQHNQRLELYRQRKPYREAR
jgi:tetratricopeptide (TPR) repeat protein